MTTTEHPAYATCTGCTQSKGVKKDGRMKVHNRTTGYGSWQMTVECIGSGRPYAEANRQRWDSTNSRWVDMPIEVPTTLHDGDATCVFIIESHPFPKAKAGYAIFVSEAMSVHLYLTEENSYANTYDAELRNAAQIAVKSEPGVRDDGHLNGLMLRWLEQLADEAKDKG